MFRGRARLQFVWCFHILIAFCFAVFTYVATLYRTVGNLIKSCNFSGVLIYSTYLYLALDVQYAINVSGGMKLVSVKKNLWKRHLVNTNMKVPIMLLA